MADTTFDLSGDPLVIAGEEYPRVIRDTRTLADGRSLTVEYSPDHMTLTADVPERDRG
jgi:hypothetical protein